MKPGDTLSLRIEKPAAGGRMIARESGRVILVSGAIPNERVSVQVDRIGKGVAYGSVIEVEEPSTDRRPPFVDPACGGCLYAHINYPRQLAIKADVIADALARIGHISWPASIHVAASPDEGYRMRARLHVRGGRVGFFREGTHDLCEPRATRQLLPQTCDLIVALEERLQRSPLNGELELSENIDASERGVHLESSGAVVPREWGHATDRLGLSGVTLSHSGEAGGQATVIAGNPHVTDVLSLDGHAMRLRRHIQAFFQGNRFLLSDLAARVIRPIATGDEVVDLYAGAGLFSLSAAMARGAHVTAVEGDRFGAGDLLANVSAASGAVHAVHSSVESFVGRRHTAPAVVIVDPPRTGMSKEALAGTIRLDGRTVVYVSCDVATLARDARRLLDAGYRIQSIEAFDLFPNTPHVETVVVLQK